MSKRMTSTDDLTFAGAPLTTAEVAELCFTEACDVVTSSPFLDNVPALETLHPMHLTAIFENLVLIPGY